MGKNPVVKKNAKCIPLIFLLALTLSLCTDLALNLDCGTFRGMVGDVACASRGTNNKI